MCRCHETCVRQDKDTPPNPPPTLMKPCGISAVVPPRSNQHHLPQRTLFVLSFVAQGDRASHSILVIWRYICLTWFVIIHDKVIECDKYQVYSTSSCFRFGSHRSFLASFSFVFLYVSMSAKHFILLLLRFQSFSHCSTNLITCFLKSSKRIMNKSCPWLPQWSISNTTFFPGCYCKFFG